MPALARLVDRASPFQDGDAHVRRTIPRCRPPAGQGGALHVSGLAIGFVPKGTTTGGEPEDRNYDREPHADVNR